VKVLVLGGDGFCGWPTALHLSAQGYEVAIADNLSRRKIDVELECESLTPIRPMGERLNAWEELTGNRIDFHNINVAQN
jgi:UDP-sulfoquinovose synthase